ncbi:MAG: Gfo/Idh/MocA family oxidoreductase [Sphingobium sp.]
MTAPIRVGLIGLGWGKLVHAPAFQAVPSGYLLAGLCARNPERLQAAARELAVPVAETDWERFVRRDDLDLIAVAGPADSHAAMTVAALRAGKHVYCEKPIAVDEAEARAVRDFAEASGLQHATGFELRWQADRLAIWEKVRAGYLGKPYFFRMTQSWNWGHPTCPPQPAWKYRRAGGMGYLSSMLVHDIDFLVALFGEPSAVAADVHNSISRVRMPDGSMIASDIDDTTTLLLRFDSGMVATINCSVVGVHMREYRIELFGEDAAITDWSEDGARFALCAGKAGDDGLLPMPESTRQPVAGPITQTHRSASKIRAMALMLEDWRPAFDGLPTPLPIPTLRDGWRAQYIIDAAFRSSGGEGWVTL